MENILKGKNIIWCALCIAMLTAAILHIHSQKAEASKDKKPNFILIVTDDQGWIDLSDPIDPDYPNACWINFNTPRINQLAREGMRFTDAYSPASVCTPSRRSIPLLRRSFETDYYEEL